MPLKLMYITNDAEIAKIAENAGVDWIFVDLEINGKEERQGHLDTVISKHEISDVKKIKSVLKKSKLLVRVNPIFEGSKDEIDSVIEYGADIVMLPFFKTKEEVNKFIGHVNGRAKAMLLVETPEAVRNIDSILGESGIDYIHIGLNDLHLGYRMKFMFEPLVDGTVEMLCKKIKQKSIPYGFGGIARLGTGLLPAENILAEHYRLGSSMVILSRSFCNVKEFANLDSINQTFKDGIADIRKYEAELSLKSEEFFLQNKMNLKMLVDKIKNSCVTD
ncbi:MAG TPA: aldolase [Hungateiclostridium thermocellum]|jgi:2-keto-3-deoxy-L-rhamnonate aldolase RhmA|uniref:HpcH/HpaI aldolase n=2 Tax=Acetivibrio thermocellus TaxID=1515 RepID=A3DIR9_ACET2|nr:aldolase/citrate lyase family protein [Acetivibrio thermocellus]CDG37113.1 HpcH/HpaI aldolase [Acetivibrio thermocellus BC1]ABN53848.1 HpcH/HpaI aldolase [Acetivibrio thermocellus ATCC 27405]ADU73332.1 HpcH/HpaI aldolase [Acetivibrio thermocellus DSM 1313]ALX07250.1 HpcH/HpaI aldolase [Acetivibrio thermocellus AD2]ANV74986.1 HpcH/HpaI aldolase [Acetivibrio thermocellus DSM 2360]